MEHDAARPEPGNEARSVGEAASAPSLAGEWDELRRLAEKHRESDDPVIAKALEEALVGKARSLALSAKAKPAWLEEFPMLAAMFVAIPEEAAPVTPEPAEPKAPPAPAKPDDPETADRLIREAHLWSTRGDKAKAKELLDQAEAAAPNSGAVLIALGDAARERRNLKEAVRLYAQAMKAEPGNIAYERKHADAVFEQSRGLFFDPTSPSGVEAVASAKSAVLLSVMLPGVGQIVTGEIAKGVFFLVMVVGGWTAALLIGFKGLFAMLGMGPTKDAEATVLIPLAIAVLFHLIAIFDASAKSKTIGKRKIDRPVPPSNLPFE